MSVSRLLALAAAALAILSAGGASAKAPAPDESLREAWELLSHEKFPEAARALRGIDAARYDLGDYAVYFTGLAHVGAGNRKEAEAAFERLGKEFPGSPLSAYLAHELAFLAARVDDLEAARTFLASSRDKVSGNGRRAEEGYVAARLLEGREPGDGAARAHLDNFAAFPAQEGAALSMERLWAWRKEGKFREWQLPVAFYGKFADALARASEGERADAVYEEAVARFPPTDEYYSVLLAYAELLRKQGDTKKSKALVGRVIAGASPAIRADAEFLQARVDWKAGKLADARSTLLRIAATGTKPSTVERARYLAAWLAEEDADVASATEEFGRLRGAKDETIRRESTFRYAFGLLRQKRYADAIGAFEAGQATGFSTVERARNTYWKGVALIESGRKAEGQAIVAGVSNDPGAGPYALFARRDEGRDPFAMLNAPSSGETAECGSPRLKLWDMVLKAPWADHDLRVVRRAERLVRLGIVEYAILEADRIDRRAVPKELGLASGGSGGLLRFLSGDLRGGIRATTNLPEDPAKVEPLDLVRYPIAPDLVGDCDRRKSGIDPMVLHAVMRQESQFQPNILSPAGAVGLMQLLPRTAAETARREKMPKPRRKDLLRPSVNVALGAAYLSRLVREYGGDYVRAVAAYNAGESAVGRWWGAAGGSPARFLEMMTFKETRFYVRRVFFNLLQYYQIYRPRQFARYFPTVPQGAQPGGGGPALPPIEETPGLFPSSPWSFEVGQAAAPTRPPLLENAGLPDPPAPALR